MIRPALALIAVVAAAGQSFEAATVKPAAPSERKGGRSNVTGDRVTHTNQTLATLLLRAYGMKFREQIAGPSWIFAERYDIAAKMPEGASADQLSRMMRDLLIERFQLKLHQEKRELSAYALLTGKGRLKMQKSGEPTASMRMDNNGRQARMDMDGLAGWIAFGVQRPVVDMTGLEGLYEFPLEMSLEEMGGVNAAEGERSAPSIITIVEGLGLKLESRKLPFDVLVVDGGNQVPIGN
jgi:uncharacterized protein (TIGR03435 family)